MRFFFRCHVIYLCLVSISVPLHAQVGTTAPATATKRSRRSPEQQAANRVMNEQDPAIPAPKIGNVDGTIDAAFARQHEAFRARGKEGPVDLLFLGDSITAYWATRGKDVWAERYPPEKYHPANFGIGGDKTQHVLWRIANGELDDIHPKVVVLMIGTNNNSKPAEDIARGTTACVTAIRGKLPDAKILLLAIFPRGELPSDPLRTKIANVNPILSKLDDGRHVFYLDFGSKFLAADGTLPKTVMPDFLHPSAEGYRIWADAIQPKLEELFTR